MSVVHPILPTAVAIKQAMDDIYAAAHALTDISPWLDERGRLPFKNILPMLQSAPNSGSLEKDELLIAILADGERREWPSLESESVYRLQDNLNLKVGGPLYIPACKYIGSYAFKAGRNSNGARVGLYFKDDANTFASLEEIADNAFGDVLCHYPIDASGKYAATIVNFPKLKTIGTNAIQIARELYDPNTPTSWPDHIYLPAIESMGEKAIVIYKPQGPIYDPMTMHFIHFPGKTMAQVKAMANYPRFTVGAYRYVCDDGDFQPPEQEG